MNFQTEYKNLNFNIVLEKIEVLDIAHFLGDKFNRLPNRTLIELKKGTLVPYNLIIESNKGEEVRTHYWSKVLLTSNSEDLIEELGYYLDDEEILDLIVKNWKVLENELGPAWTDPDSK